MILFWKSYFIFIILYEIGLMIYLSFLQELQFLITDIFYALFFVGLFGFAFSYKIFSNKIWKYIFVIAAIIYFHSWIVMPLVWIFSEELSLSKVLNIQLFSIPLIPLIIALYFYAWRSEKIWMRST